MNSFFETMPSLFLSIMVILKRSMKSSWVPSWANAGAPEATVAAATTKAAASLRVSMTISCWMVVRKVAHRIALAIRRAATAFITSRAAPAHRSIGGRIQGRQRLLAAMRSAEGCKGRRLVAACAIGRADLEQPAVLPHQVAPGLPQARLPV